MNQIKAYLNICLDDKRALESTYKSLLPEVKSKPSKERGEAYIRIEDKCIVLEIVARDISSLRAMLNGYLYLVHALLNTIDVAGGVYNGGKTTTRSSDSCN